MAVQANDLDYKINLGISVYKRATRKLMTLSARGLALFKCYIFMLLLIHSFMYLYFYLYLNVILKYVQKHPEMLKIRNHQVTRHETKRGVPQHQLSKCYLLLSNIFYHILEKKGTQDTEVGKKAYVTFSWVQWVCWEVDQLKPSIPHSQGKYSVSEETKHRQVKIKFYKILAFWKNHLPCSDLIGQLR